MRKPKEIIGTDLLAQLAFEGYVVTPIHPTGEMRWAGGDVNCPTETRTSAADYAVDVYKEMIATFEASMSEPPFKPGDKVKTDFYKRDSHLVRTVEAVYPKRSDSGWFVATRDEYGRGMAVDANWYTRA